MTGPPIDLEDVLARVDGDRGFLAELFDTFAEDYASRTAGIAAALDRGDFASVADLGHALKGASANLGLPFIRGRAEELEKAAKSGDGKTARTRFAALDQEFRRFVEYRASHPLK